MSALEKDIQIFRRIPLSHPLDTTSNHLFSFNNVFTKLSLITTEPLELEYMSAICKRNDVDARICDLTIRGKSLKYMLKHFNPDIVAMTANFVHIYSIKKYVKIIKKFNPNIITLLYIIIKTLHLLNYKNHQPQIY